MPVRFPLVPIPAGSAGFNVSTIAPPAAAPSSSVGCEASGPYLAWCKNLFPDADSKLFVFAIYGLSSNAVVSWTASLDGFDEIVGPTDRGVIAIRYLGGAGGSVTATVDGQVLGSAPFGAAEIAACNE